MASTGHRYAYLDGIRGVAALFVVMRHTVPLWDFQVFRTYLAVDIFFILSGFVIANAYGRKMEAGTMSLGGFFLVRLVRLYPMYVMSLCIAIPAFLMGLTDPDITLTGMEIPVMIALSLLLLPGVYNPGGIIFPVNGPYWSLFYEVLANILYGIFRPRLSVRVLTITVVVLGLLLMAGGVLQTNLDYGFTYEPKGFFAGLVRASFGIFYGVLLFKLKDRWFVRPNPWLAIALICVAFLIPSFGRFDFVVDMLAIWFLFPLCVMLAATTTEDGATRTMVFLGSASYPVYVLHEPLGLWVLHLTNGAAAAWAPYSGWIFLALLAPLAALLERKVDDPLRRWFTARYVRKTT